MLGRAANTHACTGRIPLYIAPYAPSSPLHRPTTLPRPWACDVNLFPAHVHAHPLTHQGRSRSTQGVECPPHHPSLEPTCALRPQCRWWQAGGARGWAASPTQEHQGARASAISPGYDSTDWAFHQQTARGAWYANQCSPLTHGLVCAAAGDDQRKKLLKQRTCTQLTMSSSATPEATTASDLTCKKKRKTKGVRRREAHHQPGGGGTAEDDFQHVVLLCRKLHEGGHNDVSSPPTPVARTSQIKNRPSSEPATTKPWEPTVDGKPVKQLSP